MSKLTENLTETEPKTLWIDIDGEVLVTASTIVTFIHKKEEKGCIPVVEKAAYDKLQAELDVLKGTDHVAHAKKMEDRYVRAACEIADLQSELEILRSKESQFQSTVLATAKERDAARAEVQKLREMHKPLLVNEGSGTYRVEASISTAKELRLESELAEIKSDLSKKESIIARLRSALKYYEAGKVLFIDGSVNTEVARQALADCEKLEDGNG